MTPLSPDEDTLLGHYRRLKKHHKHWRLEILGSEDKHQRQTIELRPTPYLRVEVTPDVFDVLD